MAVLVRGFHKIRSPGLMICPVRLQRPGLRAFIVIMIINPGGRWFWGNAARALRSR